jgi:hypothetical protein
MALRPCSPAQKIFFPKYMQHTPLTVNESRSLILAP